FSIAEVMAVWAVILWAAMPVGNMKVVSIWTVS
ncbi:putative ATP-binding component of a transport system, partial [Escherichia coli TA249]